MGWGYLKMDGLQWDISLNLEVSRFKETSIFTIDQYPLSVLHDPSDGLLNLCTVRWAELMPSMILGAIGGRGPVASWPSPVIDIYLSLFFTS